MLPRNRVHVFLSTIPNLPGTVKQASCIRNNGKAKEKDDCSGFLLLPCAPVFYILGDLATFIPLCLCGFLLLFPLKAQKTGNNTDGNNIDCSHY